MRVSCSPDSSQDLLHKDLMQIGPEKALPVARVLVRKRLRLSSQPISAARVPCDECGAGGHDVKGHPLRSPFSADEGFCIRDHLASNPAVLGMQIDREEAHPRAASIEPAHVTVPNERAAF